MDIFIRVSKKTLKIKQAANFNSYLKKKNPSHFSWSGSHIWKPHDIEGGFRERVRRHEMLGKHQVLRNTC